MSGTLAGRLLNGQPFLISVTLQGSTLSATALESGTVSSLSDATQIVSQGTNSSAAIAQGTPFVLNRVFSRDAYTGNPTGWATTYNKGWGAVPVRINPSGPGTLYAALYDAESNGALTTTAGSGTSLQSPVAVANVVSGSQIVNVTVPGAKKWFYLDLALNSNMTNALRIPQRFGVGAVMGYTGTSHSGSFLGPYAEDPATIPDLTSFPRPVSPYGVGYQRVGDNSTYNANAWQAPGDNTTPYVTTFGPEFLYRCVEQLGVTVALVGLGTAGGSMKDWNPDALIDFYGNPSNFLGVSAALDTTKDSAGKWKIDCFISLMAANDYGYNLGTDITARRLKKFVDAVDAKSARPCAFVFTADPAALHGDDSSAFIYYKRATENVATGRGNSSYVMPYNSWYAYQSGHSNWAARVMMARDFYRAAMQALGPSKGGLSGWGPRITSATRTGTAITLTVTHDGGTALSKHKHSEFTNSPWLSETTTGIANSTLLGSVRVYPAGKAYASNGNAAVALDATNPMQIINGTTLQVNLASDPGNTAGFDLYLAGGYEGQVDPQVVIVDDNVDADGLHGRALNQNFRPIYAVPPSQPAFSLSVSQPLDTAAGAWILLHGAGTGTPLAGAGTFTSATSLEVSVNGGSYAVPDSLIIKSDNSWSCFVQAPNTVVSGAAVNVRRVGQSSPDASTTVNLVTARDTLPASVKASAVAFYDASNYSTLFQNSGGTTPVAHMQSIALWKDSLGTSSNNVLNDGSNPRYTLPYFVMRNRAGNFYNGAPAVADDSAFDRPAVQFETNLSGIDTYTTLTALSPAIGSQLTGDFSVYIIGETDTQGNWWQLGVGGGPRTGMYINGYLYPDFYRTGHDGNVSGQSYGVIGASASSHDEYIGRYTASTGVATMDRTATGPDPAAQYVAPAITDTSAVSNFGALHLGSDGPTSAAIMRIHALVFFNRRITDQEVTDLRAWGVSRWAHS